jgi:hypothetical protein
MMNWAGRNEVRLLEMKDVCNILVGKSEGEYRNTISLQHASANI